MMCFTIMMLMYNIKIMFHMILIFPQYAVNVTMLLINYLEYLGTQICTNII